MLVNLTILNPGPTASISDYFKMFLYCKNLESFTLKQKHKTNQPVFDVCRNGLKLRHLTLFSENTYDVVQDFMILDLLTK